LGSFRQEHNVSDSAFGQADQGETWLPNWVRFFRNVLWQQSYQVKTRQKLGSFRQKRLFGAGHQENTGLPGLEPVH
jgi:hypothetical protein